MTWIEWMPVGTGILYAVAAVGYARRHEWGWALAFGGYSFSNIGLIWAAIASRH